jgi:hypothetical protein
MNISSFNMRLETCKVCHGYGKARIGFATNTNPQDIPLQTCYACGGTGMVYFNDHPMFYSPPWQSFMLYVVRPPYLTMPDVERYVSEAWGETEK